MKRLEILWKDLSVMNIYCYENLYFNVVNPDNLIAARKEGFILSLFSDVDIISLDLPNFIKNRVPFTTDIYKYIKDTNCILETDSLSINFMEK